MIRKERTVRHYAETALAAMCIWGGVSFFYWLFRGDFDRLQIYWKIKDTIGDFGVVILIFALMVIPLLASHYCLKRFRNGKEGKAGVGKTDDQDP